MAKTPKLYQSTWQRVRGLAIHTRVAGDEAAGSQPIVLVHGLGVSSRYLLPILERLAGQHPIFVPSCQVLVKAISPGRSITSANWRIFCSNGCPPWGYPTPRCWATRWAAKSLSSWRCDIPAPSTTQF